MPTHADLCGDRLHRNNQLDEAIRLLTETTRKPFKPLPPLFPFESRSPKPTRRKALPEARLSPSEDATAVPNEVTRAPGGGLSAALRAGPAGGRLQISAGVSREYAAADKIPGP